MRFHEYKWSTLLHEYVERYVQATISDLDNPVATEQEIEAIRSKGRAQAPYMWCMEGMANNLKHVYAWINAPESPKLHIPKEVLQFLENRYGKRPLIGHPLIAVWEDATCVVGDISLVSGCTVRTGDVIDFLKDVDGLTLFRARHIQLCD